MQRGEKHVSAKPLTGSNAQVSFERSSIQPSCEFYVHQSPTSLRATGSRRTPRWEGISAESRHEDAGARERDTEHGERERVGARLVKTEAHQHRAHPCAHGEDREHTSVDLAERTQPEVTANHESNHIDFGAE